VFNIVQTSQYPNVYDSRKCCLSLILVLTERTVRQTTMQSERFDSSMEHAPAPVAILDNHYRFVKVNRAMAKVHRITSEAHVGLTFDEVVPSLSPLILPLLTQVFATGEPAEVEILGEPAYLGTTSPWLAVCFPSGESEIGFMALQATDRRIEDAVRITNRHLESALADLERSVLVHEMAHFLQGAMVIEELYRIVASFAPRLFPRYSGALCVIDSSRNVIETTAIWGDSPACEPIFSPDDCWALREGRAHLVSDPQSGLVCPHAARDRQNSQICVPMSAQSEMLGFLHLQSRLRDPSGETFTDTELRLIHVVAEEIALSLANVGLREILRHHAFRDPLTGLYNRRFLHEALDLELRRAVRRRVPVGLVMLDLDGFKKINDTYGHAAGDSLLQAVATLLQSNVRASDVLCRYGGDEFSIMMPETSLKDATMRADECSSAVKLLSLEWEGKILAGLTISSGVAAYPICPTSDALFREADSALYSAKASSGDQVKTSSLLHRRQSK
jgi:diguanylate cyclase (GGDEF)-like protein